MDKKHLIELEKNIAGVHYEYHSFGKGFMVAAFIILSLLKITGIFPFGVLNIIALSVIPVVGLNIVCFIKFVVDIVRAVLRDAKRQSDEMKRVFEELRPYDPNGVVDVEYREVE